MGAQQSLGDQIMDGRIEKSKQRNKIRLRADEDEQIIDAKTSSKILKEAQKQRAEIALEDFGPTPSEAQAAGLYDTKQRKDDLSDSEEEEDTGVDYSGEDFNDRMQLTADDEEAIKMFENQSGTKGRNLADIIMQKIEEKKQMLNEAFSDGGSVKLEDI